MAASSVLWASLASLILEAARFALATASALGGAGLDFEVVLSFAATLGFAPVCALFGAAVAGLAAAVAFTGPALWLAAVLGLAVVGLAPALAVSLRRAPLGLLAGFSGEGLIVDGGFCTDSGFYTDFRFCEDYDF